MIHAFPQRAALEGRARAAEDQLVDLERRHALEVDRFNTRLCSLEHSLEGERLLVARAQQQLQAELLHVKSLKDSEAAARAAEAVMQERAERMKSVSGCIAWPTMHEVKME